MNRSDEIHSLWAVLANTVRLAFFRQTGTPILTELFQVADIAPIVQRAFAEATSGVCGFI